MALTWSLCAGEGILDLSGAESAFLPGDRSPEFIP